MAGVVKNSAEALKKAYRHLPSAVYKFNDVIATKGEGSWVWTSDGNKYLDFNCGIGVTSTGHCHPHVVAAAQRQAATIVHAQQNIFGAHTAVLGLIDALGRAMPAHLPEYFFCNSGSEAVDNAVKIARGVTGRQNIIAFDGAFHGRSIGSMALTSSKVMYRQGFGPLMPGVHIAPYPYCLYCKWQEAQGYAGYRLEPYCAPFDTAQERVCCNAPLEALERMLLQQTHPQDTAGIILEPVQGEGGFLTPPPGFLAALRALCDKHGILLIIDEVQSGVGRTAKWWGHQHFDGGDVQPDLLIFAKGIASGYPLAGVAAREGYFDKLAPGTMGGTYGGNAVAVAAATATIEAIERDSMLANAEARGRQLMAGLVRLAAKYPHIVDVRGRGVMVGVELGGAGGRGTPPQPGVALALMKAAFRRGVIIMTAGPREAIRFLPPLNVTESEVDLALDVFDQSCAEVLAGGGK